MPSAANHVIYFSWLDLSRDFTIIGSITLFSLHPVRMWINLHQIVQWWLLAVPMSYRGHTDVIQRSYRDEIKLSTVKIQITFPVAEMPSLFCTCWFILVKTFFANFQESRQKNFFFAHIFNKRFHPLFFWGGGNLSLYFF